MENERLDTLVSVANIFRANTTTNLTNELESISHFANLITLVCINNITPPSLYLITIIAVSSKNMNCQSRHYHSPYRISKKTYRL